MRPIEICRGLGNERILSLAEELNSAQLKATLHKGDVSTKVQSSVVSQKAKRRIFTERLVHALAADNNGLADSLLYEWLLHHRRPMLVDYLGRIGVKHQAGETEESFTRTVPPETLRTAARELAKKWPPAEAAAYVLYLDHHQESHVFSEDPEIVRWLAVPAPATEPQT
jgi:hypothetical protein